MVLSTPPSPSEQKFLAHYDEYSDDIFRHCYFRVYDREHAKDLMQEVFIRAWEYMQKGQEIKNMRAFLYRIANNLIIDNARKKKEQSLDVLQEAGFDPSVDERNATKARIEYARVVEHLKDMDNPYRDVLVMRYMNGLSPAEIAEVTGESPNTVSVRIYRGLKQLRARVPDLSF